MAFTSNGKQVITAGRDLAVHQWTISDVKKQHEIGGQGDDLRVLPSGDQLYLGGAGKKLLQASAADLKTGRTFEGLNDWIYSVAIAPSAQRIAAGSYDGSIALWNLADGKLLNTFLASPDYKSAATAYAAP